MWEDYAAIVGKSVNDLTQAEKIQAEYNGIMTETRFQVGDAAKLTRELSGSQAKLGQSVIMLRKEFGEALAPAVKELVDSLIPLVKGITEFVKNNKELTVTLTAVTVGLSGTLAAVTSVTTAIKLFLPSAKTLIPLMSNLANAIKVLNVGLAGAAVVWGSMIVAVGAGINTLVKAKKETEELKNNYKELQEVLKTGISKQDAEDQFNLSKAQEYLAKLKEYKDQADKLSTTIAKNKLFGEFFSEAEWEEALTVLKKFGVEIGTMDNLIYSADKNISDLVAAISKYEKEQEIANRTTADAVNNQLKDLAMKKRSILETENLIKTYKEAKEGSKEWVDAEKDLAEIFPQFVTLSGLRIDAIEDLMKSEKAQTESSLNNIKTQIDGQKKLAEAALLRAETEAKIAKRTFLLSENETERKAALENVEKQTATIKDLRNELLKFDALKDVELDKITGVAPVRSTSSASSKAEKTAYERAIELYEHRKNLGQLTLEDELNVLSQIKTAHAKTTEEIWDIEERLYDIRKSISEKVVSDYEKEFEAKNRTSERWVAQQKLRNDEWELEEIAAYQRMINNHKEYLNKILNDMNVTEERKAEIRERELDAIEDLNDKVYDLRKSLTKKLMDLEQDSYSDIFKYMERDLAYQKLHNKISESEEIAHYNKVIKEHKEYLKKIEGDEYLSVEEKNKLRVQELDAISDLEDKIYSTKKQYIDRYLDDYFDRLEDEVEATRKAELEKINEKKEAIKNYYKSIDEAREEQKRNEKLAKLRKEESIRRNAVTKEGLEELAKIKEEIAKLEEDAEKDRLEKEKEAKLDSLDEQIKETEKKYDTMVKDLKNLRKQMESEAYRMAENVGDSMSSAYESIADTLMDITKTSAKDVKGFIEDTLKEINKLRTANYESSVKPATTENSNVTKYIESDENRIYHPYDKTIYVTLNDYGDKTLSSSDDVKDYTKELASAAKNALAYGY